MASDDQSNQDAPESEKDEQENPTTEESEQDEPTEGDTAQLRSENERLKKDYAALKQDYDKHAHEAKKREKSKTADPEETTDWENLHADEMRMCGDEYQRELLFFREHNVPMTIAVLEKALDNAKKTKGIKKADTPADTTSPEQGEMRASKPRTKKKPLPDWASRAGWTQERWDAQVAKVDAEKEAGKLEPELAL